MFYLLDGIVEFLLEMQMIAVAQGGLVVVPPMPDAFEAAPGTAADLLVVMASGVERFGYLRQKRYDAHFIDSVDWQTARAR